MTFILFNYSVFGAHFDAGPQAERLVRALSENGHVIRVLSADPNDAVLMSGVKGVAVNTIPAPRFRNGMTSYLASIRWHIVAVLSLHRILSRNDICIVGPNYYAVLAVALLARTLTGAKIIRWSADEPAEFGADNRSHQRIPRLDKFQHFIQGLMLRQVDAIVSSTAPSARRIATLYRVPNDRVALIEQPIAPLAIRAVHPANAPTRMEWGFQTEFVVGCSCEFLDPAALEIILDAANRLAQRRNIVFTFIGAGPIRARVETEIQRRSLANVRLPPLRPPSQMADCLAAADIHLVTLPPGADPFAIPSHFYSIAAAGRPTIFVGDTNAQLARLITRAKCGASVRNAERLQWWIEDLRRWTLLRNDMGAKARALLEARSNPNGWIDEWQSLLSTLGTARRRGSNLAKALRMASDFRKKDLPEKTRAPRQS
jgi:colanic acid biosynthesis glycosyl transferase WcaI